MVNGGDAGAEGAGDARRLDVAIRGSEDDLRLVSGSGMSSCDACAYTRQHVGVRIGG